MVRSNENFVNIFRGITNDAVNYLKSPKWIGMWNITEPAPPKVTIGTAIPGAVKGGDDLYKTNPGGAWTVTVYHKQRIYSFRTRNMETNCTIWLIPKRLLLLFLMLPSLTPQLQLEQL